MDSLWSETPNTGCGHQAKFLISLGLDPPAKYAGAIRSVDAIPPGGWVDINYTQVGMVVRCQIQTETIAGGYTKAIVLKPNGDEGPTVELQLADIGIGPYAIAGHTPKWNQETFAAPAANPGR